MERSGEGRGWSARSVFFSRVRVYGGRGQERRCTRLGQQDWAARCLMCRARSWR
jgi:hypothetical protein